MWINRRDLLFKVTQNRCTSTSDPQSPLFFNGGEGGIRTLGTDFGPYNFLAGSRFQPTQPPLQKPSIRRQKHMIAKIFKKL